MKEIINEYKEEIRNTTEIEELSKLIRKLDIITEEFKENKNYIN